MKKVNLENADNVINAVRYILNPPVSAELRDEKRSLKSAGIDIDALTAKIKAKVSRPGRQKYAELITAYRLEEKRRTHKLPKTRLTPAKARAARRALTEGTVTTEEGPIAAMAVGFKRLDLGRLTEKDLDRIVTVVYFG